MSEPVWLTMEEAELRFKCERSAIINMIKAGTLQGMKTGRHGGHGLWRILDVTPEFFQRQQEAAEHIVHVPLLSTAEVAEVTGHTVLYVQQLVAQGRLKPVRHEEWGKNHGKTKLFTVAEVRRFLFKKEKVKRAGRRVVKIDRLITWAKTLLDQQRREAAEGLVVKDEMLELIQQIMELPAQERMASLRELWMKLDLVEAMRLASEQPPTNESLPVEASDTSQYDAMPDDRQRTDHITIHSDRAL